MKTFILMWRPAISSYTRERYEQWVRNFRNVNDMNWSVWEHDKASCGDRFFLVKVGEGETGVVASGHFCSVPYISEDWSGKGRIVYYMNLDTDRIFNPWRTQILSTEVLQKYIPDFDWTGGHSGRLLSASDSRKLERLWRRFLKSQPQDIYAPGAGKAAFKEPDDSGSDTYTLKHIESVLGGDSRLLLNTKSAIYKAVAKAEWPAPITFGFSAPEHGWLPMCIKSTKGKLDIELSDVYDPLWNLLRWLENIASEKPLESGVDCTTDNEVSCTLYHYEDISWWPEKLGLLYIIDNYSSRRRSTFPSALAVLPRKEIVKAIYEPLLKTFTSIQDPDKVEENWDINCDSVPEFIDRLRSPQIEHFIEYGDLTTDPVLASFRGDVDSMRHIQIDGDIKEYLITGFWGSLHFPLWAVPKALLEIIGDPDLWEEPYNKHMLRLKHRMEALLQWWKQIGVDTERDIPYSSYADCFYSANAKDTAEEILWCDDLEGLIKETGCTHDDIELYCAAVKFNFRKTETLLRKGASSTVKIDGGQDLYTRIDVEASFLSTQWVDTWFNAIASYGKSENLVRSMPDFIGYAAHSKMLALLNKYLPTRQ